MMSNQTSILKLDSPRRHWCGLLLISTLLFGCGDLSKDSSDETFAVNAGRDRQVSEQTEVSLSATLAYASEPVTYSWSVSPTITVTHEDTTSASASLTTPVTTIETDYLVTVSAVDNDNQTATDSFILTVIPDNETPTAFITYTPWPDLDASSYPAGVELTLDGRTSSDLEDSTLSYAWQQTAGDDVLTEVDTEQSTLVITTPINDEQQTLSFTLTVTDQEGASASASQDMTILSASDTQPTISAGESQAVFSGEIIILAGSTASSVPAALPITANWSYSGDAEPTIIATTSADTYAIAPVVSTDTTLEFYLHGEDNYGNQVSDSISVVVRPFPVRVLNDTGVTTLATDTLNTSSQQNAWPGQDGHRGADVIAVNDSLDKAGRGEGGFDFTKLNSNGDEEDDTSSDYSCVRDNVTGLVWEVKTTDASLHDTSYTYSWYATDNNGGDVGTLDGSGTACTLSECNTQSYIAAVNSSGLCGFYDWRLPEHTELLSLVHFGRTSTPRIDTDYFTNTGASSADTLWYWTSQPGADGVSDDTAHNAWALDFVSGVDNFLNKSNAVHVRLVRAGR